MKVVEVNSVINYVEFFYNAAYSTPKQEVAMAAIILELLTLGD